MVDEWTLEDHKVCAKDIHAWFNLIDFYIEEMHEKKMVQKTVHGRFHPNDKDVDRTYKLCLFPQTEGADILRHLSVRVHVRARGLHVPRL